jgi:hypothetical protein
MAPVLAQPTGTDKPTTESPRAVAQSPGESLPTSESPRTYTPAEIERLVVAALERHTKDKDVVEVGLAMKAAGLLIDWAKVFGLFVVVPGALLTIFLGWFGISKFEDVRKILNQANSALAEVRSTSAQASQIASEFEKQLHQLRDAVEEKLATTNQIAEEFDRQIRQLHSAVVSNQRQIASLGNTVNEMAQELKFPADTVFAASVQDKMTELVNAYFRYFRDLGYASTGNELKEITVQAQTKFPTTIAYYMPGENIIYVKPEYVSSEYAVLRQYSHHVLYETAPDKAKSQINSWVGLEYALADYFPASFLNRSRLEAINHENPVESVIVELENNAARLSEDTGGAYDTGRVMAFQAAWREIIWEFRRELGQTIADRAAYRAWCSQSPEADPEAGKTFGVNLLRYVREFGQEEKEAKARQILSRRGLTLADVPGGEVATKEPPRRQRKRASA